MGMPYVQFKVLGRLCQSLGVSIWEIREEHCPVMTTGPADIVYSTTYLKACEAEKAEQIPRMKEAMLDRAAKRGREESRQAPVPVHGDLAKSRWAPGSAAGPAPREDTRAAVEGIKAVPFPPGRDWKTCFEIPSAKLRQCMPPAVRVVCRVNLHGAGRASCRQSSRESFNQQELFAPVLAFPPGLDFFWTNAMDAHAEANRA
ncbi:uncharacterized protein MAM_04994 [Metarhizium album ARSEF 1941]|uniref:Uncharacterized protein n=1 Tax=Metarhizium album (strain ARSEF 1941) TaxID=1081103 RepID=A0A0B2WVB7_METAS|nr:uncharacterized protein MAM_04994 [Metarhizium album ARSEF 1941]KHN97397.1 hypothetical protein MAM_04994 [Metarhizium album ARSEF 1941]